jgi:hypothetical protein
MPAHSRRLEIYWGGWFNCIGEGDMKETNLNIFYQFGCSLQQLQTEMKIDGKAIDVFAYLYLSQDWLCAFLQQTDNLRGLKDSRASTQKMLKLCYDMIAAVHVDTKRLITQQEVSEFNQAKAEFEDNFEREHRNLCVFTVTPKGLYDTRLLIEKGEDKFLERTRSVFTEQVVYDLQQSGKCLAFEVPTAMAFHVMRATETLIKGYYKVLAGQEWPFTQRDWGKYITELEKLEAVSKVITGRLREIKELNRNPLIHPEEIISMEEAPVIFDLCNGVIYYMAEEIRKRSS